MIVIQHNDQAADDYYQVRKTLKNKVCIIEHVISGEISADFEILDGHRILTLGSAYPMLATFWFLIPLLWFVRRDYNLFNVYLFNSGDYLAQKMAWVERKENGAKFDPQAFYIWISIIMFMTDNASRALKLDIKSAEAQLAIFYGIPIALAGVASFFPKLKLIFGIRKF